MDIVLEKESGIHKAAFIAALAICALFQASAALALLAGFGFTFFIGNPFMAINSKLTNWILKASVIGLGFSINAKNSIVAGSSGFLITAVSVTLTIVVGLLIGRLLKLSPKCAHLITSGTAICGGSAIASIAPVVHASEKELTTSLGTVLLLNSIALIVFPAIGHYFELTQAQFGLWCAIAIHDTSSVVGAASAYGVEALKIATTVKLMRALWIIPIAIISALIFRTSHKKISLPWFIALFIVAVLLNSYLPENQLFVHIPTYAKAGLTITLFLVGAGMSVEKIKQLNWRTLAFGLLLWIIVSVISLLLIILA